MKKLRSKSSSGAATFVARLEDSFRSYLLYHFLQCKCWSSRCFCKLTGTYGSSANVAPVPPSAAQRTRCD